VTNPCFFAKKINSGTNFVALRGILVKQELTPNIMRGKPALIFLLFAVLLTEAQNEGNNWYFGAKAGLDFSTNPPTAVSNGLLDTEEGCASISDAGGNLLFYTDGDTVWDKTHNMMMNGFGLHGHPSSTQSAIIVKQPGNANIYYIFTVFAVGGPLKYTKVDMSLNGGLGAVVNPKNVLLFATCQEKVTAARACNGIDVWIVTYAMGSQEFRSYKLTAAGVNTTAVVSNTGQYRNGYLGQLKISPQGNKLGMAMYQNTGSSFEVFDFDPATGLVSNGIILDATYSQAYGCEFSSDGTKFYGGVYNAGRYYQWDLCAGSPQGIISSVTGFTYTGEVPGSFQLAADGKIYIANEYKTFLSVINNPNVAGVGCGLQIFAISLLPKYSKLGLPNFINSYFKQALPTFSYSLNCHIVSFAPPQFLTINQGGCASAIGLKGLKWIFGDTSVATNTSTLFTPTHQFPGPGTYTVKLVYDYICLDDTVVQIIQINNIAPNISVTGPSTVCPGGMTSHTASGGVSYHWTTNVNTQTASIKHTVTAGYSVTGTATNNCSNVATFTVNVLNAPKLSVAGPDTVCTGERHTYTVSGANSYTWSNFLNSATVSLLVPANIVYSVTGTNDTTGCVSSYSFAIKPDKCVDLQGHELSPVSVFPVPANDHVNIQSTGKYMLRVMGITGAVIREEEVHAGANRLGLEDLPDGIYSLVFVSEGELITVKLAVSR
jgi:hypothetical protein